MVAITAAGGTLRAQAAADPSEHLSADEQAYAKIALALSEGGVYGQGHQEKAVHWPPGAPLLFAVAHELGPQSRVAGRWEVPAGYPVQVVVGTLAIPAVFVLASLLAGAVPGLLAAGLVAFYPPLIDASGDLLSEPLGALLVTAAMVAVVLALRRPAWWRLLAAGMLLGATVLTRTDLILVPAIAAAVVGVALWRREHERPGADTAPARPRRAGLLAGARGLVLVGAGTILLVGPWSLYASLREGQFVPVSSGGASNFFVGTFLPGEGGLRGTKHALADETRARFPQLAGEKPFRLPMPKVLATVRERRPELGREDALRAAGMENLRRYALGQPLDFAAMMAAKVERLWLHYTVGGFRDEQAGTRVVHLAIVVLALIGALTAAVRRRGGAGLWLLGTVLLYVTVLNAVLVSEARHNLAVMPLVAVTGVAGVAVALRGTRHRMSSRLSRAARPATVAGPAPSWALARGEGRVAGSQPGPRRADV